jgi:hypothetical protein
VNGSLNVPPEVVADGGAIRARAGRSGETFAEILDRHGIDVFFAIGAPIIPRANHPARYTTAHLENTPGWRTVFRNANSAVYLRANDRNRANLARVAAYYERERIPFDAQRGFDAAAVIRASPQWAAAHGILPADWRELDAAARARDPAARARIATVYALLGLYEQAAAIDHEILAEAPGSLRVARRLTWSLLHLGGPDELRAAADQLAALSPAPGSLAYAIVEAARMLPAQDAEAARALVATLPMFTEIEAQRALATFTAPPARASQRPRRRRAPTALRRARRSVPRPPARRRSTESRSGGAVPRRDPAHCAGPARSAPPRTEPGRSAARSRPAAPDRTEPRASSSR